MLIDYHLGQTSIILRIKILDSSVSTGAGLTGLTFSSSGLIIAAIADNEASTTAYTAAGSTIETITTLGTFATPTATKCRFKEVDSTNHPGVYEIQLDNARYAVSSAKSLLVSIGGATNAAQTDACIPLRQTDPYNAVTGGITALPNTACTTNASLLTSGTGTDQISVTSGKVLLQATQTGVTIPTVTNVTNDVGITQTGADKVWGSLTRVLTAGTNIVLAKGTGITGFNDITAAEAATAVWQDTTAGDFTLAGSVGKSVMNGVALGNGLKIAECVLTDTTTTVTNQLTAAQIATGVWQDTTAGDFTVASSIGKSLYTSGAAPGASGGLLIAGSNAATTFSGLTTGAISASTITASGAVAFQSTFAVTGNMSLAAGLTITQSTTNGHGVSVTGNGTGHGMSITGGSGATGNALHLASASTNGHGLYTVGTGTGEGIDAIGGATGDGIQCQSAGTGRGLHAMGGITGGDAVFFEAIVGNTNGLTLAHAGTGKDLNATTTPLTLAKTTNITGFNDPDTASIFTAVLTTQLTESYAADGVAPTLAQAIFLTQQSLHEFAIAGTTRTVKKLDGSTTAATFTLDSSTAPTSTTRAT